MKYIMLQKHLGNNIIQRIPIIFPSNLVHEDVFYACKNIEGLESTEIVSAGDFNTINCKCSGKSETLNVKSDSEEDSTIIFTYDYLYGIRY